VVSTRFQHVVQLLVCEGCCCGNPEQGHPKVPLRWLQRAWVERKLARYMHITPCYCLGPCDAANVVCVIAGNSLTWFGRFETQADYEAVFDWAAAFVGTLELPLPPQLEMKRLEHGLSTHQG
jgi:predicted metal-binding protein